MLVGRNPPWVPPERPQNGPSLPDTSAPPLIDARRFVPARSWPLLSGRAPRNSGPRFGGPSLLRPNEGRSLAQPGSASSRGCRSLPSASARTRVSSLWEASRSTGAVPAPPRERQPAALAGRAGGASGGGQWSHPVALLPSCDSQIEVPADYRFDRIACKVLASTTHPRFGMSRERLTECETPAFRWRGSQPHQGSPTPASCRGGLKTARTQPHAGSNGPGPLDPPTRQLADQPAPRFERQPPSAATARIGAVRVAALPAEAGVPPSWAVALLRLLTSDTDFGVDTDSCA